MKSRQKGVKQDTQQLERDKKYENDSQHTYIVCDGGTMQLMKSNKSIEN